MSFTSIWFLSPWYSGILVSKCLVLCVILCRSLIDVFSFSIDHCILCPYHWMASDYPFGEFEHTTGVTRSHTSSINTMPKQKTKKRQKDTSMMVQKIQQNVDLIHVKSEYIHVRQWRQNVSNTTSWKQLLESIYLDWCCLFITMW